MTATTTATTRPCETRDPEWWDTGNDGNRLAIMLCRICPGCPTNDPYPHGVIRRGGVAYNDDGRRLAQCPCGYPAETQDRPHEPDRVSLCRRCELPGIEMYRDAIIRWRDRGDKWDTIAARIPFHRDTARKKYADWTAERKAATP